MEAVARNQSERIRDESIIEREIEFYLKAPQYVADIKDRLKENELDIQWPMTRFEEGRIYFYSPRTDVQAIKRIEVRDSLAKALERVKERTKRLENALKQLSDDEDGFDLIWLFYFKKMDEYKISRLLGFKSVKDMQKARDKAL
ncbi:MAG: hypothetical protein ACO1OT_09710, partial [Heyndrickxia sp.]